MNEYSKGGNVIERRYVNKDEDYETRYAKDKPSRMGYKDERMFKEGGEMGKFAEGSTEMLKVELVNNIRTQQGMNKVMSNNDMSKTYVGDAMKLQARAEDLVKELKHRGINIDSILYKDYDKYAVGGGIKKYYDVFYSIKGGGSMIAKNIEASSEEEAKEKLTKQMRASSTFDKPITAIQKFAVGGEVGNQVNFRGDYGKKRSGIVTGKKNNGYIVATDDGNVFVESYEIDSFEEAPVAKKKRFGFFEGGGEIQSKIDKLQSVVNSKMLPESVKDKARKQIAELEKELHESKETKAEEKAEHKAGGSEYSLQLFQKVFY
jgi:F0F1-type ATP synthase epsilon subunit